MGNQKKLAVIKALKTMKKPAYVVVKIPSKLISHAINRNIFSI